MFIAPEAFAHDVSSQVRTGPAQRTDPNVHRQQLSCQRSDGLSLAHYITHSSLRKEDKHEPGRFVRSFLIQVDPGAGPVCLRVQNESQAAQFCQQEVARCRVC